VVIRGPKPRDVEELPDVLSEPFFDPELYRTRELREALGQALRAEVRAMTEQGLTGGTFYEAIRLVDEAGRGATVP